MEKPSLRALFLQMFTISTCTFGGGFVIVTLMKKRLVEQRGWLSQSEMLDMTALAQSAPGPIAVNMATYVGATQGGLLGSIMATLGVVLPSFVIISLIAGVLNLFEERFNHKPRLYGSLLADECGAQLQAFGFLAVDLNIFLLDFTCFGSNFSYCIEI